MAAKILVVDRDQSCRAQIISLVRTMNYGALEAASGEEAIDKAISEEPELILINVKLPHMNGLEVILRLKQNLRTAGICLIVYSENPGDESAAMTAGAQAFLVKPLFFDDLKRIIDSTLSRGP